MLSQNSFIDWKLVVTLGIPAIITILSWAVLHWLTMRRELAIRKREARLKALEAAYMRLATSSNRQLTDKMKDDIEMFVSEIQLYGTPRQVQLMTEIVQGVINKKIVSYDNILEDMRDTIRRELNLEPLDGELRKIWWLRLDRNKS